MDGPRDLRDAEIKRWLRFAVVESAAATYTEQAFDTQLSIDRSYIWMIHSVEVMISPSMFDEPAQGVAEFQEMQICREAQSSITNLNNPDQIYMKQMIWRRVATIGTDAGPAYLLGLNPIKDEFPVPIPYAASMIHVGITGTRATPLSINGRIGYTLRRVSEKYFYRVAQALIS